MIMSRLAMMTAAMSMTYPDASQMQSRDFKQQNAFILDMQRLICAQTTVRAGKTTGLGYKFLRAGHKYNRVMMPYIALTRDSAKNIIWPVLQDTTERLKIPCTFTEHNLTCTIRKTDSTIKLFGADMANFIARLKGIKTPIAAVDEAQDFRAHLKELVDILIARTSEYSDGQVALTGTPGLVPKGYFYEASCGKHGFGVHKWSAFENPYFPTARQFVADLIKRKNWTVEHPTIQREWYGEWVIDNETRVLRYLPERNDFDRLDALTDYVIGVDLGHDDADAIAVVGWHQHHKKCYLVEEHVRAQQGITELAQKLDMLIKQYKPLKVVMDTGGLGKKIAEEMRKRYSLPIVAAEKTRKVEFLELLDDALRQQTFFAKSNSQFAQDTFVVQWDWDKTTSDKKVVKDEPHSDIIDAVLYAYREALHWLSEPAKELVKTPIADRWRAHTEKLMNEALEKQIEEDQRLANEQTADALMALDPDDEQGVLRHFLNKRRS